MTQSNAKIAEVGKNAREDMKAYAPEILMQQWDNLFKELTSSQK